MKEKEYLYFAHIELGFLELHPYRNTFVISQCHKRDLNTHACTHIQQPLNFLQAGDTYSNSILYSPDAWHRAEIELLNTPVWKFSFSIKGASKLRVALSCIRGATLFLIYDQNVTKASDITVEPHPPAKPHPFTVTMAKALNTQTPGLRALQSPSFWQKLQCRPAAN